MKSNILFYNKDRCSGCLLCEMRCSLVPVEGTGPRPPFGPQKGECSREASFIKISLHPYLSVPMISLSMGCHCADGEEKCVEICNQEAIRFVPRNESTLMLQDEEYIITLRQNRDPAGRGQRFTAQGVRPTGKMGKKGK